MGVATKAEVDMMGKAWVGPGYRESRSYPGTLISEDGLRQYRPPSFKPNRPGQYGGPGYQANFDWRPSTNKGYENDAHLNITDMP